MPERFGERIRRVRKARGLGLRATAREVGISATFLSRIESGKEDAVPREEVIRKLAELLGENFDELMSLAGRIPEEVKEQVREDPRMPEFLRRVREQKIPTEELLEMLRERERKGGK